MNKIAAFLNNMDARAWRTIWVSLALLGGVGVMLILGIAAFSASPTIWTSS